MQIEIGSVRLVAGVLLCIIRAVCTDVLSSACGFLRSLRPRLGHLVGGVVFIRKLLL